MPPLSPDVEALAPPEVDVDLVEIARAIVRRTTPDIDPDSGPGRMAAHVAPRGSSG